MLESAARRPASAALPVRPASAVRPTAPNWQRYCQEPSPGPSGLVPDSFLREIVPLPDPAGLVPDSFLPMRPASAVRPASAQHQIASSMWKRADTPQLRVLCKVHKIDDGKLSLEAQVILSGKWPYELSAQFLVTVDGKDPLGFTFGVASIRGRTFGEAVPRDRWGSGSGCMASACEDRFFEVTHIARKWQKACAKASDSSEDELLVVELQVERKLNFEEDPAMVIQEAQEMQAIQEAQEMQGEEKEASEHEDDAHILDERPNTAPSQFWCTERDLPKRKDFGNSPGAWGSGVGKAARPLPRPLFRVLPEHIRCLELPSPLDRVYLMLPPECQPDKEKLHKISKAELPDRAFAEVLLGDIWLNSVISKHIQQPGHIKTYAENADETLSIEKFAALTCLFHNVGRFLSIGPLEHPSLLAFVKLWSNIEVLEMNCRVFDDMSVLQSLPKLRKLELTSMGMQALAVGPRELILRKCTGSLQSNDVFLGGACLKGKIAWLMLQDCNDVTRIAGSVRAKELHVNKCSRVEFVKADVKRASLCFLPVLKRGIAEMAAQPRLQWLDLQGSDNVPCDELVQAARLLKNRNGAMVWPRRSSVNTAIARSGDESLLACAQEAATEKLLFCTKTAKDVQDRESVLSELTSILRYAKSMNVDKETTELAESMIARYQTNVVMGDLQDHKAFKHFTRRASQDHVNSFKGRLFRTAFKARLFVPPKPETIEKQAFVSTVQSIFGLSESEAQLVFSQCDAEGKGFITEHDIRWLQEANEEATMDELFSLYQHINEAFPRTAGYASAYAAAFDAMAGEDAEISVEEFTEGLKKIGWETKNATKLFNALDSERRSGSIDIEEWSLIGFHARCQQMKKLEGMKKHLIHKCGSLKEAWKVLDVNDSGGLSWDEFTGGCEKLNWPVCEATKQSWYYLDRDLTGVISQKEFNALKNFNSNDFLSQVQRFRQEMRNRHSNLGDAFDALDKDGSGQISLKEWTKECELMGVSSFSPIDCRVLYHFLNVGRHELRREDFQQLRLFHISGAKKGSQEARKRFFALCGKDAGKAWRMIKAKLEKEKMTILTKAGVEDASDQTFRKTIVGTPPTISGSQSGPLPVPNLNSKFKAARKGVNMQALEALTQSAYLKASSHKHRGSNIHTKWDGCSVLRHAFSDNRSRGRFSRTETESASMRRFQMPR